MNHQQIDAEFDRQMGERIQLARKHRQMSHEQIVELAAGLVGIAQYEDGSISIPLDKLRLLAGILDIPVCYFLGEKELLYWLDERGFISMFRLLRSHQKQDVRKFVHSIAVDKPVM